MHKQTYSGGLLDGFEYLLDIYAEVMFMGLGLWSPWYVGNSMKDLDVRYGKHRIYDTPVSEAACTGAAVGASIAGSRVIVVHPRMDFMLYAMDPIVNQAAKWSYMFNGTSRHDALLELLLIGEVNKDPSIHNPYTLSSLTSLITCCRTFNSQRRERLIDFVSTQ